MTQKRGNQRQTHHVNKKGRRKLLIRQIIIAVAIIAVIALIGVVIFTVTHKKTKAVPESKTEATSKQVEVDHLIIETNGATANQDMPDRSNFAVDPNIPAGSDTATEEKIVYLTLDDGPSYNTQAVLDILDRYHAKATFFVTGANPDYAYLIKTAYDKGHTIGLHTYTHDYATVYASQDAYFQDLDAIGQVVKEQIGYVPCFIRFPGGSSNAISANYTSGIMTALAQEVQTRGYQYYDWNVSSGDGAVRTREELIAQATSGDYTNIVLLSHDSNNKETTVEALPAIIEHYQALGYQFKAIDRNTFDAHHGISN